MGLVYGGQGVVPSARGQNTTVVSLSSGESQLIPAGSWGVGTGLYSSLQEFDPVTDIWRNVGNDSGTTFRWINSDGVNFRIANQTGTVVGALVTAAGAGYTSAPVVTDSASTGATYVAVIGGAVSTTVTVVNGGINYTFPPIVQIAMPNPGGLSTVQASATCTISAGAVSTVTIVNQGAGYTGVPTISFINDPRDTTGRNASAVLTLTGAGTVTAVLVTNSGTGGQTAVPTLTFTGGGFTTTAVATAIMCFTTTAYTVTSAGSGYVGNVLVTGLGGFPTTAPSYTNTYIQSLLVRQRPAYYGAGLSATGLTTAGSTLYDGGIFPGVPTGYVAGFTGTSATSAALVSFAVGGVTDTVLLIAA